MQLPIFTVDVFTDRPFEGNPAGVVPLTKSIDDVAMLKIAAELNLSDTAYFSPIDEQGGASVDWTECSRFSLRWFTPVSEIQLCGHATLASAHVLFFCLGNKRDELVFETMSGVLTVKRDGGQLAMELPLNPPKALDSKLDLLLRPLVAATTVNLNSQVQDVRLCSTLKYLLVRLKDSVTREELESLEPNISEMTRLHDGSLVKGVSVTIAGDAHRGGEPKYDFFSRFIPPWYGVNEDLVCGSAHTVLAPYWAGELGIKEFFCHQGSKRGGDLKVSILDGGRVTLAGKCTTVITGHISF